MPVELTLSITALFDAHRSPWVGASSAGHCFVPRSYALWAFLALVPTLGLVGCLHE